jgi:hypothetical protein
LKNAISSIATKVGAGKDDKIRGMRIENGGYA